MTINADGTYTAKNGDKEESGKWKMQNGDLMLDNGATDATRCTLDGDMINAYVNGSVSVYRKGGVMKQTEKESTEENEKTDEKALMAGLADDEDSKSTNKAVEAKEGNLTEAPVDEEVETMDELVKKEGVDKIERKPRQNNRRNNYQRKKTKNS